MASPFASMTTSDPIPLPFDEGQWIQVRKLTGKEYEAAQTAHRLEFVSGDKWAGLFKSSLETPSAAAVRKALTDPLTGFDRYAIARAGLVAWSYPQSHKPLTVKSTVEGKPDDTIDPLDDLDDDAIEFIAREVLKRTKPGLFLTQDEREHERKNATGSSTAV